ncbi:unnamed protein product, partial [Fusarium langsethiae]
CERQRVWSDTVIMGG